MGIRPALNDFNAYIFQQSFKLNLITAKAAELRADAKKVNIVDSETYEEFKQLESKALEACKAAQRCIRNILWGRRLRFVFYPIVSMRLGKRLK